MKVPCNRCGSDKGDKCTCPSDYHCAECGKDLLGKVRIQNDRLGYVKCLGHGLGVTARIN